MVIYYKPTKPTSCKQPFIQMQRLSKLSTLDQSIVLMLYEWVCKQSFFLNERKKIFGNILRHLKIKGFIHKYTNKFCLLLYFTKIEFCLWWKIDSDIFTSCSIFLLGLRKSPHICHCFVQAVWKLEIYH